MSFHPLTKLTKEHPPSQKLQLCFEALQAFKELPNAQQVYRLGNTVCSREVDSQGDDLPIHVFEWAQLPNGDILLWSRHRAKATMPKRDGWRDGQRRAVRFIVPVKKHNSQGLRKQIIDYMDATKHKSKTMWEKQGILSACLVEDSVETMAWHVVRRPKEPNAKPEAWDFRA